MPAGLSSLVLQSQVFFTVLFAAVLLRERPRPVQLVGMGVAAAGIVVIAFDYGVGSPISAFLLVVLGAVAWGVANVVTRYARPPDPINFIVWVSALAVLPLLGLSLVFEGPAADLAALRNLSWTGVAAILFIAWVSTLLGFGLWNLLLQDLRGQRRRAVRAAGAGGRDAVRLAPAGRSDHGRAPGRCSGDHRHGRDHHAEATRAPCAGTGAGRVGGTLIPPTAAACRSTARIGD